MHALSIRYIYRKTYVKQDLNYLKTQIENHNREYNANELYKIDKMPEINVKCLYKK